MENKQLNQTWLIALLCIFLGCLGIHRFYVGKTKTGVAMLLITLLTAGFGSLITGIWALVDSIMIASSQFTDGNKRVIPWQI